MAHRNIARWNLGDLASSTRFVVLAPLWFAACSTSNSADVNGESATTGTPSTTSTQTSNQPSTQTSGSTSIPVTPTGNPGTASAHMPSEASSSEAASAESSAGTSNEAAGSDSTPTSTNPNTTETTSAQSAPTTDVATSEQSASSSPNTPEDTSDPEAPSDCEPTTDEHSPVGYGASTTGGGNTTPVVVASFAEAEAVLEAYRDAFKDGEASALVVRYTGNFDYGSITDVCAQHTKDAQTLYIKEVDNVTFEGAPGSSANFGIKINRAKNVIVRNMTIGLLPGGGDSDAITIEGNGTNGDVEHVWIDHNDLFSDTKDDCDGAGDTEFDGLIDIKKGARYITISYNHLHDHQKTGLLGSSDSDDMDRYVTFHHNWYENVISRTPLHRFGYIHLFNNYFDRILDSGINVRMGGVALIEANYFENAANPVTSRYSDVVGYWDLRDNHVGANVTWTVTEDTLANADDWQSTATYPASELDYEYEPDTAACVKAVVSARAGATL